jgi:hypothetical protein
MKKLKPVSLIVVIFCVLSSYKSYSQASCSGNSSHGSCYMNVTSPGALVNDEWAMTCPTGNAFLYAEVNGAEANIAGDFPQLFVADPGTASGSSSLTGLDPNIVYYVDVTVYASGTGYARLSVDTW